MRRTVVMLIAIVCATTGCGQSEGGETAPSAVQAQPSAMAQRGGTIDVGDSTWTIVPSIQCSVYPGNVVSIAGHAAEDASLEIVIDYGGPNQVRVGEGRGAIWTAVRDSIQMSIDGRRVTGSANFTGPSGGDAVTGSWDVRC